MSIQTYQKVAGIFVFPHSTEAASSFNLRITKAEAERLLTQFPKGLPFDIMCKEYGDDDDWIGITVEDIDVQTQRLGDEYETFEIWFPEALRGDQQLTLL